MFVCVFLVVVVLVFLNFNSENLFIPYEWFNQASQNVGPEKILKVQKEEEGAKPKPVETKKVWCYPGARGVPGSLVFCSSCLHFQYRFMQPSECQCLCLSTSELSHLV